MAPIMTTPGPNEDLWWNQMLATNRLDLKENGPEMVIPWWDDDLWWNQRWIINGLGQQQVGLQMDLFSDQMIVYDETNNRCDTQTRPNKN